MRSRAACMRRALVLPLLVSALTAHATRTSLSGQDTDTEPRPLVVDDLFGLRGVGNPTLSPDGSRVAFTVTTTELDEERSWTQVWTASIDGSDARPMTRHGTSAGSPSFSPDGTWLTFTASREGPDGPSRNQVWALDLRGGEARALTSIPQGVSGYRWSPDGTRLALLIRDRDPEDVDSTKTWTSDRPKPWVIDRLQFKRDGAGYLNRLRTHSVRLGPRIRSAHSAHGRRLRPRAARLEPGRSADRLRVQPDGRTRFERQLRHLGGTRRWGAERKRAGTASRH